MSFFSFSKRVKNQRFSYTPRYYDPAKEDLENRLRIASDEASTPELSKMRIKEGLRRKSRATQQTKKDVSRKSNMRLLLIVGILIVITYYFLTSDGLMLFIQSMGE